MNPRTTLILASRQATYDFASSGIGSTTTIVLVRSIDVPDATDLSLQVRCHALTIDDASNTIEVRARTCVIDESDPMQEFVGDVVGSAVFVGGADGAAEVGSMQLVGLRPVGSAIRLELVATRAAAGAMRGTFSIDLIRRTGSVVRRFDLAQTLEFGSSTAGRDIVVSEGGSIRGEDGATPAPLSVVATTALVSGQAGHGIALLAGFGMGDGEGGASMLLGGVAGASGDGGDVIVQGGDGGTTTGHGGDVNCTGGDGGEDAGGEVVVVAGSGLSTAGASVTARGGVGGSAGGKATLRGGSSSDAIVGKNARVVGGTGGSSAAGGVARVTGGTGGTSSGTGGLVKVAGGVANGSSSMGGAITAVGGDGGASAAGSAALARAGRGGTSAGVGGQLVLDAGAARASGVAGGEANLLGGAGVGSTGLGGAVVITAGNPGTGNVTEGSRVILRAHETDYAESSTSYGQGAPGTVDVTTHGDGTTRRRRHRTFSFTSNSTTTRHLQLDSIGNRQVLIIRAHVTDSGTASDFASAWTIDGLAYRNGSGVFSYVLNTTKTTPAGVAASNVTFQLTDSSGIVRFSVDPPSNTTARRVIGWIEWQVNG